MISARSIRWATLALAAYVFLCSVYAGEPPFPDELLYPNIVPPKYQFGTLGRAPGQFADPGGVAVDSKYQLYVADTSNDRIQVLSLSGTPLNAWGRTGTGPGEFTKPEGIATDGKYVYVSDTGNDRVQVFTTSGTYVRSWGTFGGGDGQFRGPEGIEVDHSRVYVADTGNERVQIFNLNGDHVLTVGSYGKQASEFNMPTDVASDDRGNFYVADSRNNRIQKFSPDGRLIKTWGTWGSHAGLFATPISVEVRAALVYVADLTNHRIQVFDRDGQFSYQWGRHPPTAHEGNGRVHYPTRLAVSPDGRYAIVCEPIENRFQVFEHRALKHVRRVNDSAWWEKATKFHYGSGATRGGDTLAVWEPDTHSIIPFDISGDTPQFIAKLGGQGTKVGQLTEPGGATVDSTGSVIQVSDAGNARLQTFKLQTNPVPNSRFAFVKDAGMLVNARTVRMTDPRIAPLEKPVPDKALPTDVIRPGVIAYDRQGNFYLYDQGYARIIVYGPDGQVLRSFGRYGTNPGEFRRVFNIGFSKDDTKIFVVDSYNFRIQIFDKNGTYISSFGKPGIEKGEFIHPFGIASGIDGFVYITDAANHNVQKFDESGNFIERWGRWGTGEGQFYKPKGIVQDERGRLYVIDFGNHRGQVLSSAGKFITAFGMNDLYGELPSSANAANSAVSVKSDNTRANLVANLNSSALRTDTVMMGMVKPRAGGFEGPSNGGTYSLKVEPRQPIRLNRATSLDVEIAQEKAPDATLSDASLYVDAVMPAHYHGVNVQPRVRKTSDGHFVVENLLLHMPGHWEVLLDIKRGDITERAQFDVVLQ